MKMLANTGQEVELLKAFLELVSDPEGWSKRAQVLEEAEKKAVAASAQAAQDMNAAAKQAQAVQETVAKVEADKRSVADAAQRVSVASTVLETNKAEFKADCDKWRKATTATKEVLDEQARVIKDQEAEIAKRAKDLDKLEGHLNVWRAELDTRERLASERENAIRATLDRFANING